MVSLAVLKDVSGECRDNSYCIIRDVLRSQEIIGKAEHMEGGGCANNGGCPLMEIALASGVPDRDFIKGKMIAMYAYENGIADRREARRRWNVEGHAEKFEALCQRGVRGHIELYDNIMNKVPGQFFG